MMILLIGMLYLFLCCCPLVDLLKLLLKLTSQVHAYAIDGLVVTIIYQMVLGLS